MTIWKTGLAAVVAAGVVAVPVAEADPHASVAPVVEIQAGCVGWTDAQVAACYFTFAGAVASAKISGGEVVPTYFVGNSDVYTASEGEWNRLAYVTPETPAVFDDIEAGEVFAPPGGEFADVDGDVLGCRVQFDLDRSPQSQDGVGGAGPSVGLWEPALNASVAVEKTTTLDGSGSICGVDYGPSSLSFIIEIVITGASIGESQDRLREAMETISEEAGVPLPTPPERVPPPQS